jgi:hypothetical protein
MRLEVRVRVDFLTIVGRAETKCDGGAIWTWLRLRSSVDCIPYPHHIYKIF